MIAPSLASPPSAARTVEEHFVVHDGLAVYDLSSAGAPLLLMPYPHGFTTTSTAEGPLAHLLAGSGRRVITFDPPGAYRSTRTPRVSMPEMLGCAEEALRVCGVERPLDLVGHSMGGLCALAFALERPEQVRRLVIVGSVSGGPAIMRNRGMPLNWSPLRRDFWRFVVPAMRINMGQGTLADHKRVLHMMAHASFVDKLKAPVVLVEPGDAQRPPPVRDAWPRVARRLDYSGRLGEVKARTLICVGRYDPQAPVGCSKELARGIPGARLVVFRHSGHAPQVEEPALFAEVVSRFLAAGRQQEE